MPDITKKVTTRIDADNYIVRIIFPFDISTTNRIKFVDKVKRKHGSALHHCHFEGLMTLYMETRRHPDAFAEIKNFAEDWKNRANEPTVKAK